VLRRLIVLRHAKSAWDTDAPTDHARPLNGRGRRDAPRVGKALSELGWIPDRVYCSDAQRTRETWALVKGALTGVKRVRYSASLFHASIGAVRRLVVDTKERHQTVMVIGHNPGWEEVVLSLSGEHVTLTTCNAALLDIEADDWASAIARDDWRLVDVIRPKDL
jgi:phosphohistidine phosphatase